MMPKPRIIPAPTTEPRVSERFPLQVWPRGKAVDLRRWCSWETAELAYAKYASRYGPSPQSLETLARRGGFHNDEMDDLLPGWRERDDEVIRLRAELAFAREALMACAGNAADALMQGGPDAYEVCKDINTIALAVLRAGPTREEK